MELPASTPTLGKSRPVFWNTLYNLAGLGCPLLLAFFCIPEIVRHFGDDRFGLLSIAWMVSGYFSFLDLGMGRALTKLVAQKLGAGRGGEVRAIFWLSQALMFALSLVLAGGLAALSPVLVYRVLNVPAGLQAEALTTFYLLGLSVPVSVSAALLRGMLEGQQRFVLINAMRIALGVFTFVGPVAVLPFGLGLRTAVAVLLAGRGFIWLVNLLWCLRVMPPAESGARFQPAAVFPLVRDAGWMTVSNLVSPIMLCLDRFLIGALISMAAVTYYATPYELVTKLLIIPSALASVMFPALAASSVGDARYSSWLFHNAVRATLLVMGPLTLAVIALARPGLRCWLGPEFAEHSTAVLQIIAMGVLANSMAIIPFAAIQAAGRADLTAKLHLMELPLYVAGLIGLVHSNGIQGVAVAWTTRVAVDMMALFVIARCVLPSGKVAAEGLPVTPG